MVKAFFLELLSALFSPALERLHRLLCQSYRNEIRARAIRRRIVDESERRKKSKNNILRAQLGKPVIVIDNTVGVPQIGVVVGIETLSTSESKLPIIRFYHSADVKEYIVFGKVIDFTWQMLDGLMRLDRDQRLAMLYDVYRSPNELNVKFMDSEYLYGDILIETLRKNGFFETSERAKQLELEIDTNIYCQNLMENSTDQNW